MEPVSKCWGWVSELVWQLETHLCPVQCLHLSFSDIRVAGGKPCLELVGTVCCPRDGPLGQPHQAQMAPLPALLSVISEAFLPSILTSPAMETCPMMSSLGTEGYQEESSELWAEGGPLSRYSRVGRWRRSSCPQPDEMGSGTEGEASSLGSLLGVGQGNRDI